MYVSTQFLYFHWLFGLSYDKTNSVLTYSYCFHRLKHSDSKIYS